MTDNGKVSTPSIARRDKMLPLFIWLGFLCLLFRPLFVSDWQNFSATKSGAEQVMSHADAVNNLLCDLLSFAIIVIALTIIILGRTGAIAYNTFREAVRNRVLYFILFFALLLMGSSRIIKELTNGLEDRIIADLGLGSISMFGTMVAVFAGTSLVYNELEKKTIYTIVSKPVHRYQFLLGKFFGLLLTVYVVIGIMTFFFYGVVNFESMATDTAIDNLLWKLNPDTNMQELVSHPGLVQAGFMIKCVGLSIIKAIGNIFGFYSASGVGVNLVIPVAMICLELLIVTAFAILFSSFSTPTLSAILTVMFFLAGRLNEDITRLAGRIIVKTFKEMGVSVISDLPLLVQAKLHLLQAISIVVPNLDSLNVLTEAVHLETFQIWRFSILYAICYTGCVMMIATLIFSRRNFK